MSEDTVQLEQRRKRLEQCGAGDAAEKQHQLGKLTARERIKELIDAGSVFEECGLWSLPFKTGFDIDDKELPGDAVVTGGATIGGRPVYLYAQDFTVSGGTVSSTHARKVVKMQERALKAGVPFVGILDSGGQRFQEAVVPSKATVHNYTSIMYMHTISSGIIPQISLIMGPCTAGPAYAPALTDFVIMPKKTGFMFISGPIVVKRVTSEDVTSEALGGTKVHAEKSGCCDLVGEDDADCLRKCRELLSYLPLNNCEKPPFKDTGDGLESCDSALTSLIPDDPGKTYDARDVIKRVFDKDHFLEIKADFARNVIVGFSRLGGQSVGVVANNPVFLDGAVDIDAADKAARFIRFCDAFNIPLVFFVDNPGFVTGEEQEKKGIIRHGAKLVYAVAEASVPKLTVYTGRAYDSSRTAMCSEELGGDLSLAWPRARFWDISPAAAARQLYDKPGASPETERLVEAKARELGERLTRSVYQAAAIGMIDDIIEPGQTRPKLIQALRRLANKKEEKPWRKHGNLPF
ncbi:MAG: acyl-CoA carboxylase subunit beta [Chloroflexi bacterium]|nr:acyl-CoA carboxylase subunit beta [Chloroflexota bacterium]